MSIMDVCSSWQDTVILIAWQFLQSREGGQAIASIGGLVVMLYYLRRGALPGGRIIAILLSLVLVVGLWSLVALQATTWAIDPAHTCKDSPLFQRLAKEH